MNASEGSFDSGCEASESDLSPDPDSRSHNSCHKLELNPIYCGSSILSDLSVTSMESLHCSQQRSRAIFPSPLSKSHKEFQYTTVTPICYRITGDSNYSTESSKRSHFSHSGKVWEGNRTNISNNDNDYETQGPRWCTNISPTQYSADTTNFDAVVMPCSDEPQQNFYFEQTRFPPGCLDIVLNGSDRNFEPDTCSDIYRESGCESDDTLTQRFCSATMDPGSGDPCSRSWCSLNSFDGCEGLEEIMSACSAPVDCFEEDELMRHDAKMLPVSVSLHSLSSSVGVDVRCTERVFCVNTTLGNSDEEDREDEAVVDMTISAKNSGCSEDGEDHYEVGLIDNYIRCSDDDSNIDAQVWVKPSFVACAKTDGKAKEEKRWIREKEQNTCWESEISGTFDGRKTDRRMSKTNLTTGRTNKRRRAKNSSGDRETRRGKSSAARRGRRGKSTTGSSSSKTSIGMPSSTEVVTRTDSKRQMAPANSNPLNSSRTRKKEENYRPASSVSSSTKLSEAENEIQRNFVSLETAGNISQSFIKPSSKALSEPAGMGKTKSGTKRSFRVGRMQLKGVDSYTSYHEPNEAAEEDVQAPLTPESLSDQAPVQATASYHQPDLVVMASTVPNKSIHYDPTNVTILAAGEFFGKPFRHVPILYPIRAIVSYEDDHGIQKNRTIGSVVRKYNRAKTKSNPAFAERIKLVPSIRSSRAAVQRPTAELSPPLSVASIRYLGAMVEEGEQLARIPSMEAQYAPSNSQTVVGYVESVSHPQLVSSQETMDSNPSYYDRTAPKKQSVSFADMNPAFEDLLSMYPSFLLRRTPTEEDELGLIPSGPFPHLPSLVEDSALNPSELLARVAAASDRDFVRPSILPCPRSDAIGTSVTQVVSRWRKHYLDNDPCFPGQDGTNTWVRSLNAKSIQFNEDVNCRRETPRPLDCTAVETNKIIYYQNNCACMEPTESELSCSSCSSDSRFIDARLPFRRSTDSTPTGTVPPACYIGRPHNMSASSTGGYRRRRISSADRSLDAMMRIISPSTSCRLDEGDGNGSKLLLFGDTLRNGGLIQGEADDLEKIYVEALLDSIRSTTKQFVQGVIADKAVPLQQQQQQLQRQQQQRQQQLQRQHEEEVLSDESVLTDYLSRRH